MQKTRIRKELYVMKNSSDKSNSKFYQQFLQTAVIILCVFSVLIGVAYYVQEKTIRTGIRLGELAKVNQAVTSIGKDIEVNRSDLMFLSDLLELKTLMEEERYKGHINRQVTEELSHFYLHFALRRSTYDQIRFLDNKGDEIIRINYNNGSPQVVPDSELQNKAGRYYFDDAMKLGRDQVYISPFDLNIENDQIEVPFKPILRFATPTFDLSGNKTGVVVLNYLGEHMLQNFLKISQNSFGAPELLNSDGYWLCSNDSQKEWGFMFKNKKQETYAMRYPKAWALIQEQDQGQFVEEEGLFSFAKIAPFGNELLTSAGISEAIGHSDRVFSSSDYYWIIVSHVSNDILEQETIALKQRFMVIWTVMAVLGLIISYFYAQNVAIRRAYSEQLKAMASHDGLTGLPNRNRFNEYLKQSLGQAKRYERHIALMFMDLDGFKLINDTYGHRVGDLLLVEVAGRIKNSLREFDMVARVGGDEFIVLLSEVDNKQAVDDIKKRISDAIAPAFLLEGITCYVGVSIGCAIYPTDGITDNELITRADHEMYAVKNAKKQKACSKTHIDV